MSTRILLADSHGIVRAGLHMLLDQQEDITVVGEAADGNAAVGQARELAPDVVVTAVVLPALNGIEATRCIREGMPQVKVLALSARSESRYVAEMLQAGASGYLLKTCGLDELLLAIRTVAAGRTYLSPAVAGSVVDTFVRRTPGAEGGGRAGASLSPRERQVLQLLAEGHSSKEIASQLHVTVRTIDAHRQRIMEKLDIHSIANLTRYTIREGITAL